MIKRSLVKKLLCMLSGVYLLVGFITPCVFCAPPMVEKHIFAPEPYNDVAHSNVSPLAAKLQKEIVFSGVIISPQGKMAMLEEARKRYDRDRKVMYREGDEIKGMKIKQIGNNFVVLSRNGEEVRLNLYQGEKKRPQAPVELSSGKGAVSDASNKKRLPVKVASGKAKSPNSKVRRQRKTMQKKVKSVSSKEVSKNNKISHSQPAEGEAVDNPFIQAIKRAMQKKRSQTTGRSAPRNPFLDIIKRNQQNR